MAKTGVYFKGLDVLKKGLRENAKLADVKKAVALNGAEMTEKAKRNAPVRTGDLRGSIKQQIKDGGLTSVTAPSMDYSAFVEWGTRFMMAQPYVRPAFNVQSHQFIKDLEKLTK